MTPQPKTVTCPRCGSEPSFAWIEISPWFCTDEGCEVLCWDPWSTPEENLQDAHEMTLDGFGDTP